MIHLLHIWACFGMDVLSHLKIAWSEETGRWSNINFLQVSRRHFVKLKYTSGTCYRKCCTFCDITQGDVVLQFCAEETKQAGAELGQAQ